MFLPVSFSVPLTRLVWLAVIATTATERFTLRAYTLAEFRELREKTRDFVCLYKKDKIKISYEIQHIIHPLECKIRQ